MVESGFNILCPVSCVSHVHPGAHPAVNRVEI